MKTLETIIVLILIGILSGAVGIMYRNYLKLPNMIFNPLFRLFERWVERGGFLGWIAYPLGYCIYCNTFWITVSAYFWTYGFVFNYDTIYTIFICLGASQYTIMYFGKHYAGLPSMKWQVSTTPLKQPDKEVVQDDLESGYMGGIRNVYTTDFLIMLDKDIRDHENLIVATGGVPSKIEHHLKVLLAGLAATLHVKHLVDSFGIEKAYMQLIGIQDVEPRSVSVLDREVARTQTNIYKGYMRVLSDKIPADIFDKYMKGLKDN